MIYEFNYNYYCSNKSIIIKINSPHFKDLEELHGETYEVTSTIRNIEENLPLQIGVAVYHLAKLRMLQFYYDFIDKYINRENFELMEMDTDSNYFAFSEDNVDKLINPKMREEYENDKYNFLPLFNEKFKKNSLAKFITKHLNHIRNIFSL